MDSRKEAPLFAPRLVMRRVVRDIDNAPGITSAIETLRYSLGECPWVPDLEVFEEAGRVAIQVDLPGMKPDEISVVVAGGRVSIQGERRREAAATRRDLHVPERTYGRFSRIVRLPEAAAADRATWAFEHGVLRLTVPLEKEAAVPAA
ncbi:MAG TPA: Hsp20/alpha crystallin family protein [Vicinamibacterales bacterium]